MKISDLLRGKGSNVITTPADATVRELVASLAEHGIGALVVVDGPTVLGIVSERDIVVRLNDWGDTLLDKLARDLMTSSLFTCRPEDDVDRIAETMTERRVRHMPVFNGDDLVGLVSIGDVVKSRIEQLEHDRGQLEHYITG
ncbi:MAG TPA: CBS domain-containing protein [Jatrophihabitantaceae bacterium]|jgi:CBS domain-containing protein